MAFLDFPALHPRVRALAVVSAFALASGTALPVQAGSHAVDTVAGKWKLTKALDSSEITALDEDEAHHLLGRVFVISKSKIRFGTRECVRPNLAAERVEPRLYLREQAHASADNLGLPNPVTVFQLGCTIAFVKNSDHLIIHWKGWFFDATKLKPPSAQSGKS